MGLETFLSDDEALVFGRSLGSGPWLFPKDLPEAGGVSNAVVRQQGCLTIQVLGDISLRSILSDRKAGARPPKAKVRTAYIAFSKMKVNPSMEVMSYQPHQIFISNCFSSWFCLAQKH